MNRSTDLRAAKTEVVAAAIERYLASHPQAADSVDGIANWWLADPDANRATIVAALDRMVAEGKLLAHLGADGQRRFSLAFAAKTRTQRPPPA